MTLDRTRETAVQRPGDTQPPRRKIHIAPPDHDGKYFCGEPIRRVLGARLVGHGPRGGGVCEICACMDREAGQ